MATYTTLAAEALEQICARYAVTLQSFRPLAGGAANSSYHLKCDEGEFVLTVLDNHNHASASDLACLTSYLRAHDIRIPEILPTIDGRTLSTHGSAPVIVKTYQVGAVHDALSISLVGQAGAALANINLLTPAVGQCGLREHSRRLPEDAPRIAARFADQEFADWILRTLDATRHVTELSTSACLVHGDLFPDNIVDSSGELTILDWETASIDLALLDLAMAIVGLCRVNGRFIPELARALVTGYSRVRPISTVERENLREAAAYTSMVIGYHRYLRHHITHPDPACRRIYCELPPFVTELNARWPDLEDLTPCVLRS